MTATSPISPTARPGSSPNRPATADDGSRQGAILQRHHEFRQQLLQSSPRPCSQKLDDEVDGRRDEEEAIVDDCDDDDEDYDDDDELDDLFFFSTPYSKSRSRSTNCPNSRILRLLDERQELPQIRPCLSNQHRPSTSRSQLGRFHRQGGRSHSQSSSKQLRPTFGGPLQSQTENRILGSKSMTKEEFAALPPTIQRKYFSSLERLRFAQTTGAAATSNPPLDIRRDPSNRSRSSISSAEEDSRRPSLKPRFSTETFAPGRRPRGNSSSARLGTPLVERSRTQSIDSGSDLYHSFILDATDEAFVRISRRQSQLLGRDVDRCGSNYSFYLQPAMDGLMEDGAMSPEGPKAENDPPLGDCLRWLDGKSELDLRLEFEDMAQQRADGDNARKRRGLLIRSRLDGSKMPRLPSFARSSDAGSRPGTKDTMSSLPLEDLTTAPLPSPQGFARRKSRALSMIVPSKMIMSEASSVVDPAASHYQDPEARMKLRVYLASPHKFDEAIEFGFPSINDVHGSDELAHGRSTSMSKDAQHATMSRAAPHAEDEIASLCSDPVSPTEIEFPKTPESMGRASLARTARSTDDAMPLPLGKMDYAQAPASCREMTLRMTLTRPDLRADEDQMYGWQKSSRRLQTRDDTVQPRAYTRSASSNKDEIEKQLAEIDHELLTNDNGVVKRFWNKVRRS